MTDRITCVCKSTYKINIRSRPIRTHPINPILKLKRLFIFIAPYYYTSTPFPIGTKLTTHLGNKQHGKCQFPHALCRLRTVPPLLSALLLAVIHTSQGPPMSHAFLRPRRCPFSRLRLLRLRLPTLPQVPLQAQSKPRLPRPRALLPLQ